METKYQIHDEWCCNWPGNWPIGFRCDDCKRGHDVAARLAYAAGVVAGEHDDSSITTTYLAEINQWADEINDPEAMAWIAETRQRYGLTVS